MSDFTDKVGWAVGKFNTQFSDMVAKGNTPVEAVNENVGLLFYLRKVSPSKELPESAVKQLTPEAKAAIEEWEQEENRNVL